jgi:hypothetical protein
MSKSNAKATAPRKSSTRAAATRKAAPKAPKATFGPSEAFARLLFRVDRDLFAAIRAKAAKDGKGIQPLMRELLAAGLK